MPSKLKPNETIGDDKPILSWQVKRIMQNCRWRPDIKAEWVQWVTEDVNRINLKSITQAQAIKIIMAQEGSTMVPDDNWAAFNKENPKHKIILSLLHQAQWITKKGTNYVPDLQRLSTFLKSDKSPVKKRLNDMNEQELEKLIIALKGIVKSKYK